MANNRLPSNSPPANRLGLRSLSPINCGINFAVPYKAALGAKRLTRNFKPVVMITPMPRVLTLMPKTRTPSSHSIAVKTVVNTSELEKAASQSPLNERPATVGIKNARA